MRLPIVWGFWIERGSDKRRERAKVDVVIAATDPSFPETQWEAFKPPCLPTPLDCLLKKNKKCAGWVELMKGATIYFVDWARNSTTRVRFVHGRPKHAEINLRANIRLVPPANELWALADRPVN